MMKNLRTLLLILLPLVLLLSACAAADGDGDINNGGSAANKPGDIPEGDYTFELQGVESRSGSVYVSGLSGKYTKGEGFTASSEKVFTFKLCGGDGGFIGYLWEPGAVGLTSRTQYYGAREFYNGYYKQAVKYEAFYPTSCSYQFNENGELTELYESHDLSGSWDDYDIDVSEDEAMDILSAAIDMEDGTAIVSYGQREIGGENCWTFAYGYNAPEKFTAMEHYAVTMDGVILKMDMSDGEYKEYGRDQ